ncbi:hypothetical protein SBADM41S_00016 [Streptomyces badius]
MHRVLASIDGEADRFAEIDKLPDGKKRWTVDDAKRRVGFQVETPVSRQEKVTAIHSLAQETEVAAAVLPSNEPAGRPAPAPSQPARYRSVTLIANSARRTG